MEHRPGDFDKYVDTVLKHFKAGEAAPIFDGIDLVKELTIEQKTERLIFMSFLLEEGLLRDIGSVGQSVGQKDNPNVRITPKGYMIACLEGGWNEYIKHTKELEKLKNDLVSSSILTNQSSIRTNKTTRLILGITVLISALGAYISWLNYDFIRTHQEPSRRTIDSLSNRLIEQQNQTLQDLRGILKADSLRKNLKVKK